MNVLQDIIQLYNVYVSDASCVYCSVTSQEYSNSSDWIVILQKTKDTITDENRTKVKDSRYAMFMGSCFAVLQIFNKLNPEITISKLTGVMYNKTLTYNVNEIINHTDFTETSDYSFFSPGIYYFKLIETAFNFNLDPKTIKFTGEWVSRYINGRPREICSYIDGIRDNLCIKWYENDQREEICCYSSGELHGLYTYFFNENKSKQIEGEYVYGKKTGKWTTYYSPDIKKYECYYTNDKLHGKYLSYYKNERIHEIGEYINGTKTGKWCTFYENGIIKSIGEYLNDFKVGHWTYRFEDGTLQSDGDYIDDKESGVWIYFYKDKEPAVLYVNGLSAQWN